MRRKDDLSQLIALRKLRLDRATTELASRAAACDAARGDVEKASAAAIANGERRVARENALFERLAMRPLTHGELGRAHDALLALEAEGNALDCAEQEAIGALEREKRKRREASAERIRLERERDKLAAFADRRAGAARRRDELLQELDVDDDFRKLDGRRPG